MKKISNKELRKNQLGILKVVHDYCVKNGIKYFLIGGTLIGAIRHNGYIPWDDDIDIAMLRDDYEKFINSFRVEGYYVASPRTIKDFYLPFAKVVDKSTILKEHVSSHVKIGVNIDVFPLDNVPNNRKKAKRQYKRSRFLYKLITMKSLTYKKRVLPKQLMYYCGKIITAPLPYRLLTSEIEKNAKSYMNEKDSVFVAQVVHPMYKEKTTWRKKLFNKVMLHDYEGEKYNIPEGFDKILKTTYGDYMQFPPKEKRVSHHGFDVWWK